VASLGVFRLVLVKVFWCVIVLLGVVWGLGRCSFRLVPVTVCFAGIWAWWGFRCGLGFEVVVLCSLPVCWPGVVSVLPYSCRSGAVFGLLLTLLCVVFCVGDACILLVRSDSFIFIFL
jgi:hypothetical protein